MICGIYGLRCIVTDKWYIGQSRDVHYRWHRAYELMHCKNQTKIYHALLCYGCNSFEKRVIEMCENDIPQDVLDKKETDWIRHFNSIEHGYNLKSSGRGGKLSMETRAKLSRSCMGRVISDEARQKIGEASRKMVRRPMSKETREKMSASAKRRKPNRIGKRHSEASKKKMSEALFGRKLTTEHRQKIFESCKGFRPTEDHIRALIAFNTGKKRSEETKAKLRAAWERRRLVPISDETRQKLSESQKRRWKKLPQSI